MKNTKQYVEKSDKKFSPLSFYSRLKIALNEWGFMGLTFRMVARSFLLKSEKSKFVRSEIGKLKRKDLQQLLRSFKKIEKNIQCAHSPLESIILAKYILNLNEKGPIIECGCFKGGSSAKLSILAKMTGRELWICDSFEGLPAAKIFGEDKLLSHDGDNGLIFGQGEYTGTLDEVKNNIELYGEIDVCKFIPGFYENTLSDLDVRPAFVFIDVDLVSSARDCLKYLWHKSQDNAIWFTHEAIFTDYINGIFNNEWWRLNLNENPPIIFGAGSGFSTCAEGLAMFYKSSSSTKV